MEANKTILSTLILSSLLTLTPFAFALENQGDGDLGLQEFSDYPMLVVPRSSVVDGKSQYCTGQIIGGQFVMTAEHCIDSPYGQEIVEAGSEYQLSVDIPSLNKTLKALLAHHHYPSHGGGDFALWQMESTPEINKVFFVDPRRTELAYNLAGKDKGLMATDGMHKDDAYLYIDQAPMDIIYRGFGGTNGNQLTSGEFYLLPPNCEETSAEGILSYCDAGSWRIDSQVGIGLDNVILATPSFDHGYEGNALTGGDSGGAFVIGDEIIAIANKGGRERNEVNGVWLTHNAHSPMFVNKDFILKTVDGWHSQTIAEIAGSQSAQIKVQSLHVNPVSADNFTTSGDVVIEAVDCSDSKLYADATDGMIHPYDICTLTVSSAQGEEGRLMLGDSFEIVINKPKQVEPEQPETETPDTGSSSGGDDGGSLGWISLFILTFIAGRRFYIKK